MGGVMVVPRRVEPEWLDTLPADDPDAARSRRDLRRINAWMFQTGIMARLLARNAGNSRPRTIVDLGAGDGTFMLGLARRMALVWHDVKVILVDRQNIVSSETREHFEAARWRVETVAAGIFDFLEHARPAGADIVMANLFLHHFGRDELKRLLDQAARLAPRFVACEPRRRPLALAGSRAVWMIGCNRVTRHDAVASVRAGFIGRELSELWPANGGWQLHEHAAGLFTHCFAARHGD
jgi:hypothetical protein